MLARSAPALRPWLAPLAAAAHFAIACQDAPTRACVAQYEEAQEQVRGVEARSVESVRSSLSAVSAALESCRAAKRHTEAEQLLRAKNELSAQEQALLRRAQRQTARPAPEARARLAREGDASCPRGQAYRLGGDGPEVRCTGPQIVEMSAPQAREYFQERDYKVRGENTRLSAEHGSERYLFEYADDSGNALLCLTLTPRQDVPWREALARVAGAKPASLKDAVGTLRTARGSLPYRVDESTSTIRLGECSEQK